MTRNGICGVKFGHFLTFDRPQPSWILEKKQNAYTSLFHSGIGDFHKKQQVKLPRESVYALKCLIEDRCC
jgi:hypothetical protein